MKVLNFTLRFIGTVQLALGIIFLLFPQQFASFSQLEQLPGWGLWMFTQMGARFIGYGIGMFAAATNPRKYLLWIETMIGIQLIDWIGTMVYLMNGSVTLSQVSTAPFLPILFIIVLGYYRLNVLKTE